VKTVAVQDQLFERVEEAARKAGYIGVEDFVTEALEEKMLRLKRERFASAADRIRARREELGVTEEEILADFERFRDELQAEESRSCPPSSS
jgi:hypothetical protein